MGVKVIIQTTYTREKEVEISEEAYRVLCDPVGDTDLRAKAINEVPGQADQVEGGPLQWDGTYCVDESNKELFSF